MAPLTWREVTAPNFANVARSQQLAAQLLNNSFGSLSDALGDFQKARTGEADRNFLAQISQFTDPASLEQALRSGIATGAVSPDALKFAMQHRRHLLGNDTVQLQNQGLALTNEQTDWNNRRIRGYEASRPDAVRAMTEISNAFASGTPEGNALGQQLMQQYAGILGQAGVRLEDIQSFAANNTQLASSNLNLQNNFIDAAEAAKRRSYRDQADAVVASQLQIASSPEDAIRRIQADPSLDPEVAYQAINKIADRGSALFGGPADAANTLAQQALLDNRIIYKNQGATRNKPLSNELQMAMSPVLSGLDLRMEVISGGQDADNGIGSTRHNDGHAGDVVFYTRDGRMLDYNNPQDIPIFQEIVRRAKANGVTGFGAGPGYMGKGMMHLGFGKPAVWGKDGKGENAPAWLREAYEGAPAGATPAIAQAIFGASAGQQGGQIGPTNAAAAQLAANAGPTLSAEAQNLLNTTTALINQGQSVIDSAVADEAFNRNAPLLAELAERPNRNAHRQDIAEKLHKEIGDQDGLTKDDLLDQIDRVSKRYGVSNDVAAAFIKNAITQTTWGARWAFGSMGVDHPQFDRLIRQFIDYDAKTEGDKLRGTVEQYRAQRAKQETAGKIQQLQSEVAKAQQEYLNAVSRAQSRKGVDIEGPRLRYQSLLAQLQALIVSSNQNPLIRSNTASLTGR